MALGLLWAALIAVAVNMGLGMAWYGLLFGKPWMEAMGVGDLSREDKERMQQEAMPGYVASMVGAVVAVAFLWVVFGWIGGRAPDVPAWFLGLALGLGAWLGFYVVPSVTTTFFEDRDPVVWAIGAGYWGTLAMVYGVLVGVFHGM